MKKSLYLFVLLVGFLFTSCGVRKNFAYLQDMYPKESYRIAPKKELLIKPNDRLSIMVTCKEPDLAKVFNIQGGERVSSKDVDGISSTSLIEKGYRVDEKGNIIFPLLGKIHIEGLTIQQASNLIESKIESEGYIKDPLVIIEILNFKYTVLGATRAGVFTAEDGEMTLLEAIAKSGDIEEMGRLDRITVIREVNGERKVYVHDIRTKDIFNSPCYYLQQNDIIYVEPKYRIRTKAERGMQIFSTVFGFLTTIATVAVLFKK